MRCCDPQVIDLAFLRQQTAGDEALEHELLGLLAGQCDALLPVLTTGADETRRREAAHSLRGAAAGLGAMRLAASARAIEWGERPAVAMEDAIAEVRHAIARLGHGAHRRDAA